MYIFFFFYPTKQHFFSWMVTFIAKKKAVHENYIDKQKTKNRKDDNQKTSPRVNKRREDKTKQNHKLSHPKAIY